MTILLPEEPGLAEAYADEQPVREVYWHPGPGDVVIDIGAAVGSYALPALAAGATVIAVDPDREATGKLGRVAELNGLDGCAIRNCAVFDTPGYPPAMRDALENSEYSYLIPHADAEWVTLDALAEGLERLDWVKIDAEGAELGILRSGMVTLARFRPRLLIEDHEEVYPYVAATGSRRQCRDLLEELGYEVTEVPWGPPPRTYLVAVPQ